MDNEIAIANDADMINKTETIKSNGMGLRLKKAREAMHLTEKEAAARLYLNPKIIAIIENESFLDGPPITFMRGYFRSYARMLNFPEAEINTDLQVLENAFPKIPSTAPVLHATPINHSDRYIRWITYLIIATLIILVCLWWNSHSKYVIADVPATDAALSSENVETMENTGAALNTNDNTATTSTIVTPANAAPSENSIAPVLPVTPAKHSESTPKVGPTAAVPITNSTTTNSPKPMESTATLLTPPPAVPASPPSLTATPTAERDGTATLAEVPKATANVGSDKSSKKHKKRKHKTVISNMAIAVPE